MTKTKLIRELQRLQKSKDPEMAHDEADNLLLTYIDDKEIGEAYDLIKKWYA